MGNYTIFGGSKILGEAGKQVKQVKQVKQEI